MCLTDVAAACGCYWKAPRLRKGLDSVGSVLLNWRDDANEALGFDDGARTRVRVQQ